jgi:hypothetical protein
VAEWRWTGGRLCRPKLNAKVIAIGSVYVLSLNQMATFPEVTPADRVANSISWQW